MATPLHRLPPDERLEVARAFVGRLVDVEGGRTAAHAEERYRGVELVAVATPVIGTVADDLLIIRGRGVSWTFANTGRRNDTLALSIANVRAIRLAAP